MNTSEQILQQAASFSDNITYLAADISKIIVGQKDIVNGILTAFFAGGHVLLEGLPGLGKTLLAQTLSNVLGLSHKRIQFTPDLMPADILGTNTLVKDGEQMLVRYERGPIFANLVLADEINRATPRTQSALLQAMQERQITISGNTYDIPNPFIVIATQNPIEMEGTYPLPEAQLDRFLYKFNVAYPDKDELIAIAHRTTEVTIPSVEARLSIQDVKNMLALVPQVCIADFLLEHIAQLILATQPQQNTNEMVSKYVLYGASPRGMQAIVLGAKVRALMAGRVHVGQEDIDSVILPALHHRLILNFEGEADGITTRQIIEEITRKS